MRYLGLAVGLLALPAAAQDRVSHCIAIADAAPEVEYLHHAAWQDPVEDHDVRIRYVDHSMFLIQAPDGTDIVTDYAGYLGAPNLVPDAVTMNNAHRTHWTATPDPRIPHPLAGWPEDGVPADHALALGDTLIRNVTTDIRSWDGRVEDGNSIFVFETAGLCIGHLGHLHHEPTEAQYAALGRVDVLMAAVDGGLTVDLPTMAGIVSRLRSSVILPMHWFSGASLERFLDLMGPEFDIRREGGAEVTLSLNDLPSRPTVVVLEPKLLSPNE